MFRSNTLPDFPQTYDAWAEVSRARGVPEVSVRWLSRQVEASRTAGAQPTIRLIDVRQPDEFTGPLGHIEGAELVPLMSLAGKAQRWKRDDKIVLICRSGGRSAQAAMLLEHFGFEHVASFAGGMMAWRQRGLPIAFDDCGV